MKYRQKLPILFILFLSFYTLLGLSFSLGFESPNFIELREAFIQAAFSSSLVLVLGMAGGLGILVFNSKVRILLLLVALIPQLLPSSIFMSSMLLLTETLGVPFKGFNAVILSHVFLNVGFASYLFYQFYQRRFVDLIEVYKVFNLKLTKLFFLLKKINLLHEIGRIFSFLFLIHSLSFAVPLILSDGNMSFEQILYEALIKGKAAFVGFLTISIYFIFGFLSGKRSNFKLQAFTKSDIRLKNKFLYLFNLILLISVLPLVFYFFQVFKYSLDYNVYSLIYSKNFLDALKGQISILMMGLLFFFLTIKIGLIKDFSEISFYKLFVPSTSLLLFTSFILSSSLPELLIISLGSYFSIILFIMVILKSSFTSFHQYEEVCRVFTVEDRLSIFLKTEKKNIILSFLLICVWMSGDYVFAGTLAQDFISFSSLSMSSLARYEVQSSVVYSFFSLMSSLVFVLIFVLVVYGKNSSIFFSKR